MPNQDKIAPIKPIVETMKAKSFPFKDTYGPEKPATSLGGPGSLVEPKGRSVTVKANAPKEETETIPAGNIHTPDTSGNYSIRDVPPQDR